MPEGLPPVNDLYRSMGRMLVRFLSARAGAECIVTHGAVLACSGLEPVSLNCVLVFAGEPGDADDEPALAERASWLREFVALVRGRRIGGYVYLGGEVSAELAPVARELGLEELVRVPLMARPAGTADAAGPSPAGPLTVEIVADEAALTAFLAVNEAAFDVPAEQYAEVLTTRFLGAPGVTLYLGRVAEQAALAVCVYDDDGGVVVSGMATIPALQGRGLGGRLLGHVLRAHDERARAFCLAANSGSRALYARHGFAVVDEATAWLIAGS
jgi:GNAT superfamily N-acetyltransferase